MLHGRTEPGLGLRRLERRNAVALPRRARIRRPGRGARRLCDGSDLDRAGRPNWIDATESTDQDALSTGGGIVYLYWMMSKGHTAAQITQAGCPDGSLASNYTALNGGTNAWWDFSAAVAGLAGGCYVR